MLNWEVEFKKWCPAFKLLTYYGSAKERRAKRQGWSKPNAFHVAITSYTLVLQVLLVPAPAHQCPCFIDDIMTGHFSALQQWREISEQPLGGQSPLKRGASWLGCVLYASLLEAQ